MEKVKSPRVPPDELLAVIFLKKGGLKGKLLNELFASISRPAMSRQQMRTAYQNKHDTLLTPQEKIGLGVTLLRVLSRSSPCAGFYLDGQTAAATVTPLSEDASETPSASDQLKTISGIKKVLAIARDCPEFGDLKIRSKAVDEAAGRKLVRPSRRKQGKQPRKRPLRLLSRGLQPLI